MRRFALLLKLSLRNVFRNRRRSLFALATIAMGTMGLFVFMGFNRGIMNQYRDNTIRARWGHGLLYIAGYRGKAHSRPWELWIDNSDNVIRTLGALPGVVGLFPRLTLQSILAVGSRTVIGQGEGVDGVAEARFFTELNFVDGGDFQAREDGIILGKGLADGLGVKVGDPVVLLVQDSDGHTANARVTVTGIFHTGSYDLDNRIFRIPLKLAQALLKTSKVESIAVGLSNVEDWPSFVVATKKAFPELEAVPFDELDRVYYRHAVDWLDSQFNFIRGIVVIIVFLGIFNTISMTIMERIGEIGALRANGESRTEVALGMGLEATILGLLGGGLGLLCGLLLCAGPLRDGIAMPPAPGITRSFRILIELSMQDGLQVVSLAVITSLVGCLLPVTRAVRMPITAALRQM
jgi:putative ABC transport system permease protein